MPEDAKIMAGRKALASELTFPFSEPPANGDCLEIAPGVLWFRLPLPFQLDHVNIYLIRDGDGWAVIDTGIRDDESKAHWLDFLAGRLAGARITQVIVTHLHPDHIGLAGWLCREQNAPMLASYSTYMGSKLISLDPKWLESRQNFDFYTQHGMSEETALLVSTQGHEYLRRVEPLPQTFLRLVLGDVLNIGNKRLRVISGDGHAPEQIMLYCEEDKLFFAADQIIASISPNISVWAWEPNGDPLGHYLRSLRWLGSELPEDVLVLPGHRLPFYGVRQRCEALIHHHEHRCDLIKTASAERPMTVAELVPVLFPRPLDPHQMSFAFTETLAHTNRLVRRGELIWETLEGRIICRLVR